MPTPSTAVTGMLLDRAIIFASGNCGSAVVSPNALDFLYGVCVSREVKAQHDLAVVILCGGKGSRIYPFSEYFPKPMMPISGRPILVHLMQIYARYGFRRFVLAAGHRKEMLFDYFEGRFPDWEIKILDTGVEADTGDRILACLDHVGDQFFATYGDGHRRPSPLAIRHPSVQSGQAGRELHREAHHPRLLDQCRILRLRQKSRRALGRSQPRIGDPASPRQSGLSLHLAASRILEINGHQQGSAGNGAPRRRRLRALGPSCQTCSSEWLEPL